VQAARRGTPVGFLEDGGFTRLREVAVTVAAPPALLKLSGAQTLDLVVSGRNLVTWTDYSGLDPEVNFTGSADPISSGEWLTQPNPRVWTVRLVVNP
jgi:TonB-dependent starch-binding outer membrane protein SusC